MDDMTPSTARSRQLLWLCAFALNLIVPGSLGLAMTSLGGRIGMGAAILLLWYLGHRICVMNDATGRALVLGSFIVAAMQLFPILQIIAGIMGMAAAKALGLGDFSVDDDDISPPGVTELGGLIAAGLTGLTLMGVAACCGAILGWLTAERPRVRLVPGSALYDRHLDG
jgi:hypothetical protein